MQQEGYGADKGKNFLAPELLRACDSSELGMSLVCWGDLRRGCGRGSVPSD